MSNPRPKWVRPVRTEPALEVIYGRNPVYEVLVRQSRVVDELLLTTAAAESHAIRKLLERAGLPADVPRRTMTQEALASYCGSNDHQGLALVVDPYEYTPEEALEHEPPGFLLALDGITDPMNLGAILRSARCVGVDAILLPGDHSAPVNPTVVKASAGATESLRVIRVANFASTLQDLHERGHDVQVAESASKARGLAIPVGSYLDHAWERPLCLVLGSEGEGVRRQVLRVSAGCVYIPMAGDFDSLNVSAAAAVLLFGIVKKLTSSTTA